MTPRSLHVVVPGSLDQRTGGYVYDARMVTGLRGRGWRVTVHELVGDFPGPDDRELSDTVRLLATLSEFVIVDLSDPRSVPLELQATVPGLMIPVVPIIEEGKQVFAMFQDLQRRYFWVLPPVAYQGKDDLASHVEAAILRPVRSMQDRIARRRGELFCEPPLVSSLGEPEELEGPIDFVT